MTLDQRFRLLVFLQVLLGILAFCMAQQNPGLMLVVGAIASASWYLTEGPGGRFLPRWMVNVGSLLSMGWLAMEIQMRGGDLPLAMGHFIMTLQVLMLYARKTSREYSMVLVLSLLQIIGASVLSVSLVYGLFLLAYCGLSLVTLMLLHLKATADWIAEQHQHAAPRGDGPAPAQAALGRVGRRDFARAWALLGGLTTAVAVVAFITIPRSIKAPNIGLDALDASPNRTTAFAQTVDLTGSAPASVMHLTLERNGQPTGADAEPWLIRGAVLDAYDPVRMVWSRGLAQQKRDLFIQTLRTPAHLTPLLPADLQRSTLTATLTLRDTSARFLFTPALEESPVPAVASVESQRIPGVSMNTNDRQLTLGENPPSPLAYTLTFAQGTPEQIEQAYQHIELTRPVVPLRRDHRHNDPRQPLAIRHDEQPPIAFAFVPGQQAMHATQATPFSPWQALTRWTQGLTQRRSIADRPFDAIEVIDHGPYALSLPPQALLIREYALRVLSEAGIDAPSPDSSAQHRRRVVQTLVDHLRQHFAYSTKNPPIAPGQDPITRFLYQQQQGHCELFASTLTLLCRSLGLPARVITGYRAAEFNTIGLYYVVRHSHAHAWSEVDLGGDLGWHTFDPTPAEDVNQQHNIARPWAPLAWLHDAYVHLEYTWLRSVVAYDHRTRTAVFQQLQMPDLTGPGPLAQRFQQLKTTLSNLTLDPLFTVIAGIILLTLAAALASLAKQLATRRRRLQQLQLTHLPTPRSRSLARKLRFYLYMLDLLERHGHRRPHWQTPGDFAQELADANPMKFDPVVALTDLFYEVRFGQLQLTKPHHDRIDAHLRQLERGLTHKSDH